MMQCVRAFASVAICSFVILGCGADSNAPLVATHVAFATQPSPSVTAGQSLGKVSVAILAADGQIVAGTPHTVTIALLSPSQRFAVPLGGTTTVEAIDGVASFSDLTAVKAGADYQLVARVTGLDSATTQPFTVSAGPPSQLSFGTNLGDWVAQPLPVVVRITDAAGNVVPTATNVVTIGSTRTRPYGFTVAPDGMFGPTTAAAVNGVATFSGVNFHKSGYYTLSATSPGLPGATSAEFSVFAGAMTTLMFVTQPQNGTAGVPLAPFSVRAVDDYGNGLSDVIPGQLLYRGTISLGNNPGGAALGGTLTAEGDNSPTPVAIDFNNVTIDKPGTGYTLVANADIPRSPVGAVRGATVTSAPFNIK